MASSPVDFINRRSTNSYKKNVNGYIHPWLHSSESENSNVDLSWLPDYCHKNLANASDNSNHQNDFDYSWLPDTNRKTSTTPSKSNNSIPSRKNEKNLGLPSTPNVKIIRAPNGIQASNCNNDTKIHNPKTPSKSNDSNRSWKPETGSDFDDSWLPNYNDAKNTSSKSSISKPCEKENHLETSWLPSTTIVKNKLQNHSNNPTKKKPNHSRKTETGSDDSWLTSTSIVNNGNKKKEIINDRQSSNHHHHSEAAACSREQEKILIKKPESSTSQGQASPCSSVETDSLGGVSTLLRRWKDMAETSHSNSKHSSPSKTESTKVYDSSQKGICKDSKATNHVETEKIRVVDNVKKLSTEEAAINNTSDHVADGEDKCFSTVTVKKQGHQAFNDFLQLMEQEKRRELESLNQRKPVSKFPNRGRIQAMLRVRFIRLGIEPPPKEAKSYKRSVSKTMKTIWDKFSTGVKHGASSRKVINNGETKIKEATNSQELESTTSSNESSHSIQTKQDTNSEIEATQREEFHEKTQLSENMFPSGIEEKRFDESIQDQLGNCNNWIGDYSQSQSEWDEEDDDDDGDGYYYNHDWIRDVSRPRSDWECMRQKRYQEMLHLYSYNQDIQQLLQRSCVSGFLSSNLRNNLDKLMVSRAQIIGKEEETKYKEEDDIRRQQCNDYKEFTNQNTCSSTSTQSPALEERSWSHPHAIYDSSQTPRSWSHPHAIYDSFQTPSQTLSPSLSVVNPYLQLQNSTRQSLSFNQPSIEMELIYELREQVEQLQQEIMELRKSVTSCVNMQQSVEKKREQISGRHKCCVCYATQADSLLYRCGHMCTCYDCGLELQCTTKKCPICEARIVDVVRAYGYVESVAYH